MLKGKLKRVIICSELIITIISFFYLFNVLFYSKIFKRKIIPKTINIENIKLYNDDKFFIQNKEWSLTIPSLNLYNIPIIDSIEDDILKDYIGHFPISSYLNGNICLAAHNSGFDHNYFQYINTLKIDDEIIYNYNNYQNTYLVNKVYQIPNNDFSFVSLDDTEKITLITCVSDSPNLRLCVEAILKEWLHWQKFLNIKILY